MILFTNATRTTSQGQNRDFIDEKKNEMSQAENTLPSRSNNQWSAEQKK